jgi:uncharacterized membrane protein
MEYLFILVLILGVLGVALVLPIVAISKVSALNARVARLAADVLALQAELKRRSGVPQQATVSKAVPEPRATTANQEEMLEQVAKVTSAPMAAPAAPIPDIALAVTAPVESALPKADPPAPVPQPKAKPASAPPSVSFETIVGGKVLNRIGAVAIVFGAVFFFKWAVDNNLISEAVRVIIGLLAGVGAIVGAALLRNRGQHIVAQGIVGIGSAVLYLSVFAAFNWYSLVPHPVAYVGMLIVTLVSAWRAYVHHSPFLAALAAGIGFMVPKMLPTDHPSTAGLFMHVVFIDLLVMATIALRRTWQPLYALAFVGTCLWQWIWYVSVDAVSAEQPVAPFMAGVFVALCLAIIPMHRARTMYLHPEIGVAIWSLALMLFSLFFLFTLQGAPTYMADAAMVVVAAAIYGTGWSTRKDVALRPVREAAGVAALAALLATIYVHHSVAERVMVVGIAALASTWLSRRDGTTGPQIVSVVVLLLAAFTFMMAPSILEMDQRHMIPPFVNLRFAAAVILAVSLFYALSTRLLQGTLAQMLDYARYVPLTFLAFGISLEVHHWIAGMADRWAVSDWYVARHHYWLSNVAQATVFTALVALLPSITRWSALYRHTLAVQGVAIVGALTFLYHIVEFEPESAYVFLMNVRVGATLTIAVALALGWLASVGSTVHRHGATWMAWAPVLLVTFLTASFEAADPWNQQLYALASRDVWDAEAYRNLASSQGLAVSITWVVYAAIVLVVGFARRIRPVRLVGIAVLGIAILKVFVFDLQELETPYRILSFVALGLVLLSVSFFYGRLRKYL